MNLYYTHAPGVVTVDLRGPKLRKTVKVRDFPRTTLPFDTYDVAYFSTDDLNLQQLFEEVTGAKNRKKALRDFLEKPVSVKEPRKTKADRVREMVKNEKDDDVIAGLIHTDKVYVQRIRKSVESTERD